MQVPSTMEKAQAQEERFIAIPLRCLRPDTWMNFSTYVRVGEKYILYRDTSYPVFGIVALRRLLQNRVGDLYIEAADRPHYLDYVAEHLAEVLAAPDLAPGDKAQVIYNTKLQLAEQAFAEPVSQETVVRAERVIGTIVEQMVVDLLPFQLLLSLLSRQPGIYVHSVNVSVYSLFLAYRSGIVHPQHLRLIGLGGLLHDIGKAEADPQILGLAQPPDRSEASVRRLHPEWGRKILEAAGCGARLPKNVALQHHERNDGSGYPHGLASPDIAWEAKLVAIADTYENLTSARGHKDGLSPYEALHLMTSEMMPGLDRGLFRNFVLLLGGL